MPSLADLQSDFAKAIRHLEAPLPDQLMTRGDANVGRRFDIYRNNHIVGLTEALGLTFPVLQKLVGDEFFQVAAREYVLRYPPRTPVLLLYGSRFGDFLDQLPGTARFPYLGDVARLEWCRIAAFHAADAPPARIDILSCIPEAELTEIQLVLHPSVQMLNSRWPVWSIWRDGVSDPPQREIEMDQPEQLLITRPDAEVMMARLEGDCFDFCQHLTRGCTLGVAAERTVRHYPETQLSTLLITLFQSGGVVDIWSETGQTIGNNGE